jgi:hypothetical protein
MVDVKVYRDHCSVRVYPLKPLKDNIDMAVRFPDGPVGIMYLKKIDTEQPAAVIGAPTAMYAYPEPSLWQRFTSWARR